MKKFILTPIFALLLAGVSALMAQSPPGEKLGLPGDNLNLYAVMDLFQNSETLEAFERSLNDPELMINNLDLNGDNYVDYIMVYDYTDDNIHTIVLRVALNRYEHQDVAVFTVERLRNGGVQVQLIGDEALYGPNYIIEPIYAERPNPGYRGNVVKQTVTTKKNKTVVRTTTYYEVANWPVIVYITRPSYRPWRSTWYWGYYPTYWHPWTPHYWHYYHGYHYNWYTHYHTYYRPWNHYRCVRYRTVYYTQVRNYSPTVVVNVNKGVYKTTYNRPEKLEEGKRLHAHRVATGTTTPTRRVAANSPENRPRSAAPADVRSRESRTVNEARSTTSPARSESRTSGNRESTAPARSESRSSSDRVSTAPARQQSTAPARTESQSSGDRVSTAPARQSTAAPARQTTTAPARQQSTAPARQQSTAPARTESRSTPSVSNSNNSRSSSSAGTSPSGTANQRATSVRSSEQSSRSSSATQRSSAREQDNSSRTSGSSRQQRD